jgi:very-short-patch-repair endonuclease
VMLGPLVALPHPIPSKRLRRVTFIPTTLGRLCAAREINDLWIRTVAHEKLWNALRQVELEAEYEYPVTDDDEAHHVAFALPCRDGKVAVIVEDASGDARLNEATDQIMAYLLTAKGWKIVRLSTADIDQDATAWATRVAEICTELGGLV